MGALYMLLLAAIAGGRGSEDDSDIGGGRRADAVHAFIEKRYAGDVRRVTFAISATALAIGIGLGLCAWLVLWLRNKPRKSAPARMLESLAVVAFLHASFFAYAMAKAPQLYASKFYALGGVSRLVQVIVTDTLGRSGVTLLALAVILFYARPHLLSRLRVMAARIQWRARVAIQKRPRVTTVALSTLAIIGLGNALPEIPRAHATPEKPDKNRPNVIIIAADSLRNDHVKKETMPHLTALGERATRFDRAYVSLPRTFSSWVTLLTGRYAFHHGVRSMFPRWEDRAKDFDALPERLKREGYQTGVVSDYAGDIFGRVDLGFDLVDTPGFDFRTLVRQRALERETPLLPFLHGRIGRKMFPVLKELNDAADPEMLAGDVHAALSKMKDAPFFLTVFFSTAHFPYAAPAPYYEKFASEKYRGRYKYHKPVGLSQELPPDADDIKQIRALYAGATSAIDDAIDNVMSDLDSLGLKDNTIVIVTADHGETLFDNGHGQGHGDHLFGDEGTHVPLIILDPRKNKPQHVPGIVRDVDLAPTIYDLLSVKKPDDLDGLTLEPVLRGEPLQKRIAFAETELWFTEEIPAVPPSLRMPYPGIFGLTEIDSAHNDEIVLRKNMEGLTTMARHRMAKDGNEKLVYIPTREGVKYMLFDTAADPLELTDISAARPQVVNRLKNELFAWMLRDPKARLDNGYVVQKEDAR